MKKIEYRNIIAEFSEEQKAIIVRKDSFVLTKIMSLGLRGWKNQAKKYIDNWYSIQ